MTEPNKDTSVQEGKLYAGKYKTIEEWEKGHAELTRMAHDKATDAARWKKTAEDLLSEADVARGGNRGANENTEAMREQFLSDPHAYLDGYGRKIKQETFKEVSVYVSQRDMVRDFMDENPSVRSHPRLFAVCLAQTDDQKDITDRLTDAKAVYEKEIETIKAGALDDKEKARQFEAEQKRKAAAGAEGHGIQPAGKKADKEDDSDKGSFDAYMKDRSAERARTLGTTI